MIAIYCIKVAENLECVRISSGFKKQLNSLNIKRWASV